MVRRGAMWARDVEEALKEALALYPPEKDTKLVRDGTKYIGRNKMIAGYILKKTGKMRTQKQISSHLQVIRKRYERPGMLEKNDPLYELLCGVRSSDSSEEEHSPSHEARGADHPDDAETETEIAMDTALSTSAQPQRGEMPSSNPNSASAALSLPRTLLASESASHIHPSRTHSPLNQRRVPPINFADSTTDSHSSEESAHTIAAPLVAPPTAAPKTRLDRKPKEASSVDATNAVQQKHKLRQMTEQAPGRRRVTVVESDSQMPRFPSVSDADARPTATAAPVQNLPGLQSILDALLLDEFFSRSASQTHPSGGVARPADQMQQQQQQSQSLFPPWSFESTLTGLWGRGA